MKKIYAIIAIIMATALGARAQANDVFVPIAKYMATGDAESLSAWFAPSLEVSLLNAIPSDCSSSQAKQIMKAFFKSYPPSDFEISHQAGRGNLKYAVGRLKSRDDHFAVTLFVSYSEKKGYQIQQLKFERIELSE